MVAVDKKALFVLSLVHCIVYKFLDNCSSVRRSFFATEPRRYMQNRISIQWNEILCFLEYNIKSQNTKISLFNFMFVKSKNLFISENIICNML